MCLFFLILSFLVLSSTGCEKKPLAEPEKEDFIYKDYLKIALGHENTLKDLHKNYSAAEKDFKQSMINSRESKRSRQEMLRIKKNIKLVNQFIRYWDIKKLNRKYEVREKYLKALKEGSEWPNELEIKEYKASKRLHAASKNWEARVPSFKDRYRSKKTFAKDNESERKKKDEE